MANYIETPELYNATNNTVAKIYGNSAKYNDERDVILYGAPRVGGSVFKSGKDIDHYLKRITQGSPALSGSALYKSSKEDKPKKGEGLSAGWAYKGQKLGLARSTGLKKKEYGKQYSNKGKTPEHLKPWLNHVALVRKENPGKPYAEVLKIAKSSYK